MNLKSPIRASKHRYCATVKNGYKTLLKCRLSFPEVFSQYRTLKTLSRTVSIQEELVSYQCQNGHKLIYQCQNGHKLLVDQCQTNVYHPIILLIFDGILFVIVGVILLCVSSVALLSILSLALLLKKILALLFWDEGGFNRLNSVVLLFILSMTLLFLPYIFFLYIFFLYLFLLYIFFMSTSWLPTLSLQLSFLSYCIKLSLQIYVWLQVYIRVRVLVDWLFSPHCSILWFS